MILCGDFDSVEKDEAGRFWLSGGSVYASSNAFEGIDFVCYEASYNPQNKFFMMKTSDGVFCVDSTSNVVRNVSKNHDHVISSKVHNLLSLSRKNGDFICVNHRESRSSDWVAYEIDVPNFEILGSYGLGGGRIYCDGEFVVVHDLIRSEVRLFVHESDSLDLRWTLNYPVKYGDGLSRRDTVFFCGDRCVILCGSSIRKELPFSSYKPLADCQVLIVCMQNGEVLKEFHYDFDVSGSFVSNGYLYLAEGASLHKIDLISGEVVADYVNDVPLPHNAFLCDMRVFVFEGRVFVVSNVTHQLAVLDLNLKFEIARVELPHEFEFGVGDCATLVGGYVWFRLVGDLNHRYSTSGLMRAPCDGVFDQVKLHPYEGIEFSHSLIEDSFGNEFVQVFVSGHDAAQIIRVSEVYLKRVVSDYCWEGFETGRERPLFSGRIECCVSGLDFEQKDFFNRYAESLASRIAGMVEFGGFRTGSGDPVVLNFRLD